MGLDLDGAAIVDPETETELKSAYTIMEEVDAYMVENMGVSPMNKPEREAPDISELVDRADDLTETELATYLMQFTQWASFFDYRLSVVTASHKIAERNRKLIDSQISLELFAENVVKAEVPTRTRVHPLHVKFETEELTLYCMKQVLASRYKAFSKQADTISRLISLREQEIDRQRRGSNIKHRGKGRPKLQ